MTPQSTTAPFHFERARLRTISATHADSFARASPFPHAVIDGLLPESVLDEVVAEFPRPDERGWVRLDNKDERTLTTRGDTLMGEATRHLLAELNSAAFVDFLGALTGVGGLVPDPHHIGGGLHQVERGGYVNIHADFNRHPTTDLERRLSVLLYLNHAWREEYCGALELWNADMTDCAAQILPLSNRCVVFATSPTSYHGLPEPLNCPPNRTRRSIALYYYAKPGWTGAAHDTLFRRRPGDGLDRDPSPGRVGRLAMRVAPPIAVDAARWARTRARGRFSKQ